MNLDPRKCLVETVRDGSPDVYIRVVHLPTGTSVSGRGVLESALRKQLIEELREKVGALQQ